MILATMGLLSWATALGLSVLSVAVVICFLRIAWGPTLADRVVAIDLIAILLVGMLVLFAIADNRPEAVRVATALALINFLGTIGFALYLQRKAIR